MNFHDIITTLKKISGIQIRARITILDLNSLLKVYILQNDA